MKMSRDFDNILNDCLERMLVKGKTVEECLQIYAEYATELESLLQTAKATKQALAIEPGAEFRARARYEFQSALQEVKPRKAPFFWSWQPRWLTTLAITLAVLMAGIGTVAASRNSMPDSPLYTVKLASEQAQLTLTISHIGKAELHAELADRRIAELAYMLDTYGAEQIENVTQGLSDHVVMMASLPLGEANGTRAPAMDEASPAQLQPPADTAPAKIAPVPAPAPQPIQEPAPSGAAFEAAPPEQLEAIDNSGSVINETLSDRAKLRILLSHYAVNQQATLRALLERAPESVKPAISQAIEESIANYSKTLESLDHAEDARYQE